ncbi:MAG: serine/threonine protein kinase, partial [Micromonosporaceae bacterium]|nr:serine/threonine protein kinase [Micromonosporaceae bacterium]
MREGVALAGRYRLRERIGAGGMGEVWRATDELLGRTVAVKVVLPWLCAESDYGRRFLVEAQAIARVHHPGVVAIHDFGEAQDPDAGRHEVDATTVAYLVMEYVHGEPLSQRLRRDGRLSPATTMSLVGQTAQALQAVHDHGIVHRDIKPANLLVRTDGSIALVDFGIALAASGPALTQPGMVVGTPTYAAPEQLLGKAASARSDVYALGLVAYECLSGHTAFAGEGSFAAAEQRTRYTPPPLPDDVPPQVAAVVSRALAIDPAQRWQTASQYGIAAQQAVRGAGQVASESYTAGPPGQGP